MSLTSSATAPSGVAAPSARARTTASATPAPFAFDYVTLTVNEPVPASLFTSAQLTLTGVPALPPYAVDVDDPSATPQTLATIPGVVSGSTVTFTPATGASLGLQTLQPNHAYVFVFYGASPLPASALVASATTVAIDGPGAAGAQSVTVSETGYAGTITESDTCAGIATVTPASSAGPSATFSAAGVASGSCAATFTDTFGQHTTVTIVVTTTGFGIESHAKEHA